MKIRNRIFLDQIIKIEEQIILTNKIAHYLLNVLRCKVDEKILIFNNDGEWLAIIKNIQSKKIIIAIDKKTRDRKNNKEIKLYFSPLKRTPNEVLIQKCTEIGITIFQPVTMEHTNISKINTERLRLIAIEAVEQSEQLSIPKIYQTTSFIEFIKNIEKNELVIACTVECIDVTISSILRGSTHTCISILIGPEGDFSEKEINAIRTNKNIIEASLGHNILKGETAAIVATALIKDSLNKC
jgi:16S rRNA (uracil1498-N3)-methyltransferase